jgi:hypothetical protein
MTVALKLVLLALLPLLAINAVLWWPLYKLGTAVAILLMILAPKALPEE